MLRYLILLNVLAAIPLQSHAIAQVEKPSDASHTTRSQTDGPVWVVEVLKVEAGQGPVWVVQAPHTAKAA